MASDPAHSGSTVRGSYRPAAPEQQSKTERLIVLAEVVLMLGGMLALGLKYHQMHKPDLTPVKVSRGQGSAPLMTSLPPGLGTATDASGLDGADASKGQVLYMQTCTTCHGQNLQGMPHQGVNLRDNKFVATTNDRNLIAFLKKGRQPADPKSTTKLLMPPKGGNPALDDDALANIVAFLRQVQKESMPAGAVEAATGPSTKPAAALSASDTSARD